MMEWVNRVGIVLEFLSFWFAAPEILGEERLRKLERRVEKGVIVLPEVLFVVGVAVMFLIIIPLTLNERISWSVATLMIVVVSVLVLLLLPLAMQGVVIPPLLRILADDERIRQRSRAVGAVLFVVGILLELIATF